MKSPWTRLTVIIQNINFPDIWAKSKSLHSITWISTETLSNINFHNTHFPDELYIKISFLHNFKIWDSFVVLLGTVAQFNWLSIHQVHILHQFSFTIKVRLSSEWLIDIIDEVSIVLLWVYGGPLSMTVFHSWDFLLDWYFCPVTTRKLL